MRRQNSPVKLSRKFGHPNHCICTRSTFYTRWSKPVAGLWLQIWPILMVLHTSRSESASTQNQILVHSSFSSCSFRLSAFPKKCTRFHRQISQFMRLAHSWRWCNLQKSCKYQGFIRVLSCIALSFQFRASQQKETLKHKLRLPLAKMKREIIL